jgi:3'-5' exoribonuclease
METIRQKQIENAGEMLNAFRFQLHESPEARAMRAIKSDMNFCNGYGASTGTNHAHHAYSGGLLVHTAEVVHQAMNMAWPHVNATVVFLGALYHDWGKTLDYDADGNKTEHARMVCHVVASYEHWRRTAAELAVPADLSDRVGHVILAHHGRREWGSPVEPATEEALIVHYADMWSANYGPGR